MSLLTKRIFGKQQKLETPITYLYVFTDCRPGPADIIFLVDLSTSTNETLGKMKSIMNYFIDSLPIGQNDFQFAAIQFNKETSTLFNFKTYLNDKSSMKAAVDAINKGTGPTYTTKALTKAKQVSLC